MRSYKIELKLSKEQEVLCKKSAGTARYAYNWMLDKLITNYEANKSLAEMYELEKVPSTHGSAIDWHKEWCQLKNVEGFQWIRETSKCCGQESLRNLQTAFTRFFNNKSNYPRFKKRGVKDSFRLTGAINISNNMVQIPILGTVKLKEKGYVPIPDGVDKVSLKQATVSRQADKWFVSFLLQEECKYLSLHSRDEITNNEFDVVGLDLGIKDLGITSYGETFHNPKAYKQNQKKLKRFQRSMSRKKKGSRNREKVRIKLAKLHMRIANIRKDATHKMTSSLVKTKPKVLVIEGLKPANMSKNRKLASSILDASFGTIKTQLQYKCKWNGIHLVIAPTFFASSKLCSNCGNYHDMLKLSDRDWTCAQCGEHHDRDVNAARNLREYGLWLLDLTTVSSTGLACRSGECHGSVGHQGGDQHRDKRLQFFQERCLSMKQEFTKRLSA